MKATSNGGRNSLSATTIVASARSGVSGAKLVDRAEIRCREIDDDEIGVENMFIGRVDWPVWAISSARTHVRPAPSAAGLMTSRYVASNRARAPTPNRSFGQTP